MLEIIKKIIFFVKLTRQPIIFNKADISINMNNKVCVFVHKLYILYPLN